jgi:hypothetical protein
MNIKKVKKLISSNAVYEYQIVPLDAEKTSLGELPNHDT